MAKEKDLSEQRQQDECNIREDYEKLQKNFNLPNFDELNSCFEISTIEEEDFLLRAIRRKMLERSQSITKFFSEVLQPEPALANMVDSEALNDSEKKILYEIYKRLVIFERQGIILNIGSDDKKEAEFINNYFAFWKSVQQQLIGYIEKIKKFWETDRGVGEDLGYMG